MQRGNRGAGRAGAGGVAAGAQAAPAAPLPRPWFIPAPGEGIAPEQGNDTRKTDIIPFLKQLAVNDANHDFGAIPGGFLGVFHGSTPGRDQPAAQDEPTTLMSICKPVGGGEFGVARATARERRVAMLNLAVGEQRQIRVTYGPAARPVFGYDYTIRRSPAPINTGLATGRDLYTSLFGDVNDIYLVVDFAHWHIMDAFKAGNRDSTKTIHYLYTPENENDPGPKPVVSKVGHRPLLKGVNIIGHTQTGMTGFQNFIPYSKYSETESDRLNIFFSNYNYQLSNLQKTKRLGKTTLSTTLTIIDDAGNISTIHNSHQQNSIASLQKLLEGILARFSAAVRDKAFTVASKYKQKRSGDWFQALAALTASYRTYEPVIPQGNITYANTYFMTHDQIALTYALTLGINCIFLSDTIAYSFTTQTQGTGELIATWNGIREQYVAGAAETEPGRVNIFLAAHQEFRDAQIAACRAAINAANAGANMDDVFSRLRVLFQNAVKMSFIEETFPDTTTLQNSLNRAAAFEEGANEEEKNANQAAMEAYRVWYTSAKDLYNRHNTGSNFAVVMTELESRDIYTLIGEFRPALLTPNNRGFLQNIKRRLTNTPNRPQDKFNFLPYCSGLPNAIKQTILRSVEALTTSAIRFINAAGGSGRLVGQKILVWHGIRDSCRIAFQEDVGNYGDISQTLTDRERAAANEDEKVNRLHLTAVVEANQESRMQVNRDLDPNNGVNGTEVPAVGGSRKKQRGGWRGGRTRLIHDVDITQTTRPMIGAHLVYSTFFSRYLPADYLLNFGATSARVTGILAGMVVGTVVGFATSFLRRYGEEQGSILPPMDRGALVDLGAGAVAVAPVGVYVERAVERFMTPEETRELYRQIREIIEELRVDNIREVFPDADERAAGEQVIEARIEPLLSGGGNKNSESLTDSAFHPLLPIYLLLDVFDEHMSQKCAGSDLYPDMIKYYLMLKKAAEIIMSTYKTDKLKAYFIGHTLYYVLFYTTTVPEGEEVLAKLLGVEYDAYKPVSFMNTYIVSRALGFGPLTEDQAFFSIVLPLSHTFVEFADTLDLKAIFDQDVSQYPLDTFKEECNKFILQLGDQIIQDENSVEILNTNTSTPLTKVSNKKIPTNRKTIKNMIKKMINILSPEQLQDYLQKHPEVIEIAGKEPNILEAYRKKFPQAVEGAYDPNAEVYANAVAQEAAYAAKPAMKHKEGLVGGKRKTYKKKKTSKRKTRRANRR